MNISGDLLIEAPREAVFDRLRDPRQFVTLIEGVRDLQEIDPAHYAALFETKVAYMKFKFKVAVEVMGLERPNKIANKIEGNPLGVTGQLSATTLTTLSNVAGGTQISYAVEAAITGKLGSIGQPVLRSKAKELEGQFVRNLRALLAQEAKEVPA
jgi:carbon monoxide dehydrogenase subunit G